MRESNPQPEVIATGTSRSRDMARPEYLRPSYDLSHFQDDQELLAKTRASIDESLALIARVDDMCRIGADQDAPKKPRPPVVTGAAPGPYKILACWKAA
jgi:hypothetical protein